MWIMCMFFSLHGVEKETYMRKGFFGIYMNILESHDDPW